MKYASTLIVLLLLFACAQITPLKGGPKDISAPVIDSTKTSPFSGQTNFKGDKIRMKFNEYIRLNKPSENIIIVPQMMDEVTITAKNKKLSILFREDLQENTTYTITFNGAIQDITEGNDSVFQYVFSTGDYIDSLQIKGVVKDAFTNEPLEKMLVGLYPKNADVSFDSIPLKQKPTYLTQTNKFGAFELNYLREGAYCLFAIEDRNKNLIYDPNERIALLDQRDFLLEPNGVPNFELHAFLEKTEEIYIEDFNFSYPGKVEVILSNPAPSFHLSSDQILITEDTKVKDSLIFWLGQQPVPKMRFYVELNGEVDTLKPIFSGIPEKEANVLLTSTNNSKKGKLMPRQNLEIIFTEPIAEIDPFGIHFYDADSNSVEIDTVIKDVRSLEFATYQTSAQRIVIDSAAIKSVYGRATKKELSILFENEAPNYFGSLIISTDTNFQEPVIVHLLDEWGNVVDTATYANKIAFPELLPGNYQLRLIFDVDRNGKWTSGSLARGMRAEKVIYNKDPIRIKSKWEKEIDWVFTSN